MDAPPPSPQPPPATPPPAAPEPAPSLIATQQPAPPATTAGRGLASLAGVTPDSAADTRTEKAAAKAQKDAKTSRADTKKSCGKPPGKKDPDATSVLAVQPPPPTVEPPVDPSADSTGPGRGDGKGGDRSGAQDDNPSHAHGGGGQRHDEGPDHGHDKKDGRHGP